MPILMTEENARKQKLEGSIMLTEQVSKLNAPKFKIDLHWEGAAGEEAVDLDLSAVLLDKNGCAHSIDDVVFYNSTRRWKTENPIDTPDFNPLKGSVLEEKDFLTYYRNRHTFYEETLPISCDGSVIGSYDDRGNADNHFGNECIHIQFSEIDERRYAGIAIIVSIAPDERTGRIEKTFGDVFNPVVTITNLTDNKPQEYLLNNLFEEFDGACIAIIRNVNGKSWVLEAQTNEKNGSHGGIISAVNRFA